MTKRRHLKSVPTEPVKPPPRPDLSYEWQQRARVRQKDWAKVHIRGDKSPPIIFPFLDLFKRRRGGRDL